MSERPSVVSGCVHRSRPIPARAEDAEAIVRDVQARVRTLLDDLMGDH